ncbi:ABC-2 type transport system permease protein [Nocardioides zeae]|uniref:Transport permease protein n=2 Tax=Nocardioides zeae TaxID=1457234 RepID=A0AAJ1UAC7_9ACTN|nr:ABC transporter permease [Nocardioides zeae]MDQ1106452.1 ABC-2 type transport system permease protein [Nocardioides zeae]MDR6173867.1 ABC-2 type transport system permease protein [Nocardioides zeae]MDR6211844.1 ABC-2 type transport system permease protein [Nocardioides zeae]
MTAVAQSLTLAGRGVLRVRHDPQRLFDVIALPVILTVLFAGVFGGAVAGSTEAYLPHLVTGVLVQIAVTASVVTGVQLRDDLDSGVFDRFRSMPLARIAPLAGSLLADVVRYVVAVSVTVAVGVVMGYRPPSWPGLVAGCLLAVLCAFALSWVFAYVGAVMRSAQAVQGASMLVLMPMTFMSNALVPVETMPGWMRSVAEVNPISLVVDAVRALAAGDAAAGAVGHSLLGAAVVVALAAPLTVRAYVRQDRR